MGTDAIKRQPRRFKYPNRASVIAVPGTEGTEGKEIAPGTLNAILRKVGLK